VPQFVRIPNEIDRFDSAFANLKTDCGVYFLPRKRHQAGSTVEVDPAQTQVRGNNLEYALQESKHVVPRVNRTYRCLDLAATVRMQDNVLCEQFQQCGRLSGVNGFDKFANVVEYG
jgi:hypothetical protein